MVAPAQMVQERRPSSSRQVDLLLFRVLRHVRARVHVQWEVQPQEQPQKEQAEELVVDS